MLFQNGVRYYTKAQYEVDTSLTTGLTLALNIRGGSSFLGCDFTVNWGDGLTDRYTTLITPTHTYSNNGIYIVTIEGFVPNFGWIGLGTPNSTQLGKIVRVKTLGDVHLVSTSGWFRNCISLIEVPSTLPLYRYSTTFNLRSTFQNAVSFNQDISSWDVKNCTDFVLMFSGASAFNQSLGSWNFNLSTSINMANMLDNCGMSEENYSRTLIGWANYVNANSAPFAVSLGALNRQYSSTVYTTGNTFNDAVSARNYLTNTAGWIITGDILV